MTQNTHLTKKIVTCLDIHTLLDKATTRHLLTGSNKTWRLIVSLENTSSKLIPILIQFLLYVSFVLVSVKFHQSLLKQFSSKPDQYLTTKTVLTNDTLRPQPSSS